MTNTALKAQIDSQITNETLPSSISPTDVGGNLKAVVDYIDQQAPNIEYIAKLTQTSGGSVVATVIKNTFGAITVDYTVQGTGAYNVAPSDFGNYIAQISNESLLKTVKIPMNFSGFNGNFMQTDLSGALIDNFTEVNIRLIPNL